MTENAGDMTSQDGAKTVLRRKVSSADPGEPPVQSRLLLRALRRSLAQAAADLCELPLAVIGATRKECDGETLSEHLSDDHLLIVLDGRHGVPAALTMDAAAVTAAIQQQTMGQVFGPAPAQRHYTGTDAAMIAPLIDATLVRAERALAETPDLSRIEGFRFGARAEDARSLALLLEADSYQVFTLSLDLAVGRMQGQLTLVLPDRVLEADGAEAAGMTAQGPSLGDSSGVVRAELTAVLTRIQMSLDEMVNLRPGDTIPLAAAALNATELQTIEGNPVAQGRLGQAAGARAVRLHSGQPATFVRDRDQGDFAAHIGPVDVPGMMTEPAVPDMPGEMRKLVTSDAALDPEHEAGDDMLDLTPEQVAAEISELAGLETLPAEVE